VYKVKGVHNEGNNNRRIIPPDSRLESVVEPEGCRKKRECVQNGDRDCGLNQQRAERLRDTDLSKLNGVEEAKSYPPLGRPEQTV